MANFLTALAPTEQFSLMGIFMSLEEIETKGLLPEDAFDSVLKLEQQTRYHVWATLQTQWVWSIGKAASFINLEELDNALIHGAYHPISKGTVLLN